MSAQRFNEINDGSERSLIQSIIDLIKALLVGDLDRVWVIRRKGVPQPARDREQVRDVLGVG